MATPGTPGVAMDWVELWGQFSNATIRIKLEGTDALIRLAQTTPQAPGERVSYRRWRVSDRLGHAAIDQLVADGRAGLTKLQLADRYGISRSTVKRILNRAQSS